MRFQEPLCSSLNPDVYRQWCIYHHVRGSEPEEEDWEDVDEVRRGSMCYHLGHFARDCRRKGKSKERGGDGGKGECKGKLKTMKGTGKKGSGKVGGSQEGYSGEQGGW